MHARLIIVGVLAVLVSVVLAFPASAAKEEVHFTLSLEGVLGEPELANGILTFPSSGILNLAVGEAEVEADAEVPIQIVENQAEGEPDPLDEPLGGGATFSAFPLDLGEILFDCKIFQGLSFDVRCGAEAEFLAGESVSDGKGMWFLDSEGGLEAFSLTLKGDFACKEPNCGLKDGDPIPPPTDG